MRFLTWQMTHTSGQADRFKAFAEQCMAEYDLDGWKAADLVDASDVSLFARKPPEP